MRTECGVALVVIPPDGGLLDSPVHALNLAVGPWVVRLGQAVINFILSACQDKPMAPKPSFFRDQPPDLGGGPAVTFGIREMGPVVSQHCMDFVG